MLVACALLPTVILNTANAMDSSPRYAQTEETTTQVKQAAAALTTSKAFAFALIGDLPYFNDMRETRELIDDINSHRDSTGNIQFVMHAGDIKAGKSPCTDELIKDRFTLFSGFNSPFILTPGDNEWTDCYRSGFNPVERLTYLRKVFFGSDNQDLNALHTVSQAQLQPEFSRYTENRLFLRENVLFATLHIVGSNNSLNPWKKIDPSDSWGRPNAERIAEFRERQKANIAWLDFVYAEAKRLEVKGLFLLSQANPQFDKLGTGAAAMEGFEKVLARFKSLSGDLTIPTIYAHGDFHRLVVDKPWDDRPHVQRVQTYGSPWIHWIKVVVKPNSSESTNGGSDALFSLEPQLMLKHSKR